jgi:hypothetical protein
MKSYWVAVEAMVLVSVGVTVVGVMGGVLALVSAEVMAVEVIVVDAVQTKSVNCWSKG